MSEAELWEVNAIYQSNMLLALSIYLTVVFAYLATAYAVGKKLSKWEASVITGLFVFASAMTIAAVGAYLNRSIDFLNRLGAISSDLANRPITDPSIWIVYAPIFMSIGMIVSIIYMYQRRRS